MRPRSSMIAALIATIVVTPAGWGQTPAALPLNAKVQETLMGAYGGALMYMSADGEHIGMAAPKGSRRVVLIDGIEGPVFDEIPQFVLGSIQTSIQFSPTGGRHAYVGRRGGDFIAVVDGKEAGTLFTSQTQQSVSYSTNQGWKFWFNDDGSRLAYAGIAPAGGGFVMVVDGVKSPVYRAIDFRQTFMNGKRFIYVAQTADQKQLVVVDGKPGPSYAAITSLTVTPDGAHYAYIASQQNATGPTTAVVIDGVAGTFYFGVGDLELAPDGRVAYVATTNRGDGDRRGGEAILVVDGAIAQRISGPTGIALQFANTIRPSFRSPSHRIAWSPDGKGFAIIKPNSPNPGVTVMVNGKPSGQTYLTADELLWSADGSRFAYLGSSQTGTFAIVDGQELPFSNISELQFSPDGKRYAFRAGQGGSSVVVDGKEVSKAILPINGSLRFSSNSKHVAYGAQTSTGNAQAFLDGVAKPTFLGNFVSQTLVQPALTFPEVFFSPDGNRIAYAGRKQSATAPSAVFVDDVSYEVRGQSFTFPSFSPDSKRFAVFTSAGQGLALMIDGKVLATNYTYLLPLQPTAARFVDNNTFRFYAIKDNQIYRVVVGL